MTTDLDDLFAIAAAETTVAVPPDALLARVLADAVREQARPNVAHSESVGAAAPAGHGFWAGLAALFGGGGVLAGLGTAAVAGLYLGFAQPAAMGQWSDAFLGSGSLDSVDLMPGVDALLSEE